MTYIIAEPCIDIKDLSCVDVCPVDCIHEFERILIIDPEECIDCFAPGEQLLTTYGLRTFEELDRYGGWRLTTRNISRFRRTIWATPTHSWILVNGERTDSLAIGDFVP